MKDGSYVALALVLCSVVVPSCSALDGFSFDGTAGRTVDGTGIKRRENRTLCKAVWFFMEWNSTFSVLERRAEQLRDIFGDIANNMANNEKIAALLSGVISAKANITSALDNAKAAQAGNNLFNESIFRDFYIAFESIKWRTDQFSLGHRNVIRGGMRVTEAWLTARELRTDFTPCRVGYNSDPANINGRGGGSSDEADDGGETDDYEWLDEELSEMEDKDDPNEDGSHDKPLYAPDATTIVTNWNSKDLEGNKTHLWDNVMRDTRSAIKAMCVSTTEVPSRQRPVPTQNMWLQGTINMTDIFRQDCQFFNGTQTNETRREEACYNLKQNVHVASKGTANIDFPPTNSRIGQALVRNLTVYGCPDYAGAYKALLSKMTDTVNCTNSTGWDTLESGSITPHPEPTCDEKKTAVEWLEFRFRTALDFMKQQLHGALTGMEAAETRLGGVVTVFNDKRASFCAAMKSLNDTAKVIDELEEQNRHWEADMAKSIAKYNEALKNASSSVEKIKAVESVNESMKDSSVGTIFSGKPAAHMPRTPTPHFSVCGKLRLPCLSQTALLN
ncbi:hypothetical protein, conserved in T. vivax [Trypanosoma vivax Y486]|uniref:Uncharacterized protein n=1 Tax=Trypanosoma vivax (strain Y486) TaxID=1055687 RepID=F9WKY1_TRYVY|nr:hypothetical protein, conserved in T. vivax [Trypanosoma vivax Y486]|eukprot:CCD18164.1 hypothetical protein, conserved in T. vivax [Trypanosoma vivax Y486]